MRHEAISNQDLDYALINWDTMMTREEYDAYLRSEADLYMAEQQAENAWLRFAESQGMEYAAY